jgi:hypothetical protein
MNEITARHQRIITEAEAHAEREFSGTDSTTDLTLWDDGDFIVQVTHGNGDFRERIIWRSSESELYPAETFIYIEDDVIHSCEWEVRKRKEL